MAEMEVDCGACYQAPFFFMLRNAAAPALAAIVVQDFKNVGFLKKNDALKSPPSSQSSSSSNVKNTQAQWIDLTLLTVYEFFRKIHNKGKNLESKKSKGHKQEDEKENDSKNLHINNLKETEEFLVSFKASDMRDDVNTADLIASFSKLDVTFLLNLLTNYVLDYQLHDKVFGAICEVKNIRNIVYHTGRKVECKYLQGNFEKLYSALEVIYGYLQWDLNELQKKKSSALHFFNTRLDEIAPRIIESVYQELAAEETSKEAPIYMDRYVMPSVVDTRNEMAVIEDMKLFLQENKLPVALCGPSGYGKSSILKWLTRKFYRDCNMPYKLVICLDSPDRITDSCDFRDLTDAVRSKISNSCPKTLEEFGIEASMWVLNVVAVDEILFLVNWNVRDIENRSREVFLGKWVICCQSMHSEWTLNIHVIRVMPLNDTLVKQMLSVLLPDSLQQQVVVALYDDCAYKELINSPDMVTIFSEIRNKISCDELLQSYLQRKCSHIENFHEQCKTLGKLVFRTILWNKKFYLMADLSGICEELKSLLFVLVKENYFAFRFRIIEDLLAAKYVVAEPEVACKDWIKQIPLFKRVFKLACDQWCEGGKMQENISYVESFLARYVGVKSSTLSEKSIKPKPQQKTTSDDVLDTSAEFSRVDVKSSTLSKKSIKPKPQQKTTSDDVLDTCAEFSRVDSFKKWSYLIMVAEYSKFQCDVMELMGRLISQKSTWIFKCKYLDEEKIIVLYKILEKIQLKRDIVISIETGPFVSTITKIWDMLSNLPALYDHATIQITILHRQACRITCEGNVSLPDLPRKIASLDKPLFITKYVGPFMCHSTPQFLRCHCMRNLEVLDVYIYDVVTLAEVLDCQGLARLKGLVIKVDLESSSKSVESFQKLRLPVLPNRIMLKLSIKYFSGIQTLLDHFENPGELKSLNIHSLRIMANFRLNLSHFFGLESLFINFNQYAAQRSHETNCVEAMDVENQDQDPPWTLLLSTKLDLPKNLERLLFRNTGFCCDSNSYIIQKMRKDNIQRLSLLDTNLTIKGVREVLKSHAVENEEALEHKFKKHCISRNEPAILEDVMKKSPRLSKEDREKKRKCKPLGKELIITSQLKMCATCGLFPCCCEQIDGVDQRDTLEDVVHLIADAYKYNILSLSYESEIIKVRKDMCGDLRVLCPLNEVDDFRIQNLENGDEWLKAFFYSLCLAQYITITYTKLTLDGARLVIEKIKDLKVRYCSDPAPFALTISSDVDVNLDEVKNSYFLHFVRNEKYLSQFKFCNCFSKHLYIRKAVSSDIYVNNEKIKCRTDLAKQPMESLHA